MIEKDVAMKLKETYQKISQIMQSKIDEYELTFGLLFIMVLINENPDASQKELAKEMKFTEGAMSSAVKRLLKLNMLKQIPLKSDMRYNRLILTQKGKSMIDDYKDYLFKIQKSMFDGFDHRELIKLHGFILKINENLDNINNKNNLKSLVE